MSFRSFTVLSMWLKNKCVFLAKSRKRNASLLLSQCYLYSYSIFMYLSAGSPKEIYSKSIEILYCHCRCSVCVARLLSFHFIVKTRTTSLRWRENTCQQKRRGKWNTLLLKQDRWRQSVPLCLWQCVTEFLFVTTLSSLAFLTFKDNLTQETILLQAVLHRAVRPVSKLGIFDSSENFLD